VEGAGGLLVPLQGKTLIIDLIKILKLPVLIVARADLGTINHTLLTVRCALHENVPLAGIVLNSLSPNKSMAEKTNQEVIAGLTDVPIWGVIPFQKNATPSESSKEKIAHLIENHLNLRYFSI
jgi:dethiobiotin synthetase